MIIRSSALVLAGLAGMLGIPGPASADVTVSVALPRLVFVAGTDVRYCNDCDEDVFFYRNVWYVYRSGGWYRRSAWSGSWRLVRVGSLPDAFMRVPPGRFRNRYGDRRWHPGHHHHPKLDTWNGRSDGRWERRREPVRVDDRRRERERASDNARAREQQEHKQRQKDKEKEKDKDGEKGRDHDRGSRGGHGRH